MSTPDVLIEVAARKLREKDPNKVKALQNLGFSDEEIADVFLESVLQAMGSTPGSPTRVVLGFPAAMRQGKVQLRLTHLQAAALNLIRDQGGSLTPRRLYDLLVDSGEIEPVEQYHVARVMGLINTLRNRGLVDKGGQVGSTEVTLTDLGRQALEEVE